jgi:hypothetical protein
MLLDHHALWAQQEKEFFHILLHSPAADERIELRYKLPGAEQKIQREFVRTPDQAASLALGKGHSHDVYAGVAPRQGNVGTKEGVTRLLKIWGDLDIKGHHTSASRLEQLEGLSCSPSILVWSGGGYHPYWLLEKQAKGSHELHRAERIMARIAEGLDGDAVHDRTRILRVPGTLNHKYDEPCPVRLVRCNPEQRYTLDQLEEMTESLPRPEKVKGSGRKTKSFGGKVKNDVLSEPICEGRRNTVLASVAGSLRDRGLDEETMKAVLLAVNTTRCEPRLSDAEVERIARSVCKYPAGNPRYMRSSVKRIYPGREGR